MIIGGLRVFARRGGARDERVRAVPQIASLRYAPTMNKSERAGRGCRRSQKGRYGDGQATDRRFATSSRSVPAPCAFRRVE